MARTDHFQKVLIVGAGPAGLLLALLLSQEGISVEVVEADKDVDRRPRAAYYGTASIPDLERAGVLHDVRRAGFPPTSFTQRLFGGDYRVLGLLDTNIISDVDGKDLRSACLPQQDLLELLLEHLKDDRRKALVTLSWGHKVVGLGQERDTAWVDVVAADDGSKEKRIQADYVVGCDGARSTVRKNLFGEEFPGKTWDFQLVSTDTNYDLGRKFGFTDANFVSHPTNFFIAARLDDRGLYRISYAEPADLSPDEVGQRLPGRLEEILPGNPGPDEYKLLGWAPHNIHQRCVPSMRVGRIMVASDAAHLCNPMGGLGITGGFVDVGGLADCLVGIWKGVAQEDILDTWSDVRREKWRQVIDPITTDNLLKTTCRYPPEKLRQRPEWIGNQEKTREFLLQRLELRYDFTQHFDSDTHAAHGSA